MKEINLKKEFKIEEKYIEEMLNNNYSKRNITEFIFGKMICDIFDKNFNIEKSEKDLENARKLIKKYNLTEN